MGNNICGIKLRKNNKADNENDEVYMSFREVINSPKRNEVIDLTIKKRPISTSTCSIRQSSTSGISSDNDIYDELPDRRSRSDDGIYDELPDRRSRVSDYDIPRCSTSRLATATITSATTEDDYDVPRANYSRSRVWLTDNEEDDDVDDDEYDIPRQHQNFDDTYDVPRSFHRSP